MVKLDKMIRFLPNLYKPNTNVFVKGQLSAWASEDDQIISAVENAKEQIYVKLAQLQYLDALGSNVGVFRPTAVALADEQYRELIPALSFYPKQVVPTIKKVLDIFFTENNPRVTIHEVNPNEIAIQIPSSVPSLRRSLKGSLHFHAYSGTIVSVDNVAKTVHITLANTSKSLQVDELKGADFGAGAYSAPVLSSATGNTNVLLQFTASTDLSHFSPAQKFNIANVKNYPGSFIANPNAAFTLRKNRGILGQTLTAGTIYPVIIMSDSSGIPDEAGTVVFNYGKSTQEGPVKYFSRPNNTTLLLDPSYTFSKNHSIGEIVNATFAPYQRPRTSGADYSVYLVGVQAARILAQQIVEQITAAGIVVRWTVVDPIC
jgi:hypothetical protein